jgi:hypothetical protein
MSGKITCSFEVTNMLIMENALKRLGHTARKTKEGLNISRNYMPIIISKNEISGDSMDKALIETIKAEYQRDYQINERAVRGEVFEVTETKDEIVIMVQ